MLLAAGALALPWVARELPAALESEAQAVTGAPDVKATPAPFVVEPAVRLRHVEPPAKLPTELPAELPSEAAAAGEPRRLLVPALGIDAPIIGIGVTDGVLLPPADPQMLGWWSEGAEPGAARGGALITGHTVHTGGGAMDDLETVQEGAKVRVLTDAGPIRYEVTGVTIYRKATLADDAARIFSQDVPGRLVLITCEDWNGTDYESNAIVFAERIA